MAAAVLGGTLVAQVIGYRATSRAAKKTAEDQRKQLDRTLDEQRTKTLNERFATAAEQLGSDKPAIRLAGVYAMAGLADDWEANRQTCVDVLCAYLRMPYEPEPGQDSPAPEQLAFRSTREVRHTVIRVISSHLEDDASVSWQGLNFDFTGVVFDGGDFGGARFSGGTIRFRGAQFSGDIVHFTNAGFSGGTVDFSNAEFCADMVSFADTRVSGGTVYFHFARFSGGTVGFFRTHFCGGEVSFYGAEFSGGKVNFGGAEFSGGKVNFGGAGFSGGKVDFHRSRFSGGEVDFSRSRFSGSVVNLGHARFSGSEVDFSEASDWSRPPAFPWANTPPTGVKLPSMEDHSKE